MTKTETLIKMGAAYLVAIVLAVAWLWVGPSTGSALWDGLAADVVATLVIFAASRLMGNSSCYDAYWSVIPPLLAAYWWFEAAPDAEAWRFGLLAVVMVLWAVRLTGNWLYSFPGHPHEDWRYPLLRAKAPRVEILIDFFAIHLFPTLQVFLAMVPVYIVTQRSGALNVIDAVAVVVGLAAVALEFHADLQMHRFVARKQPGQVMDQGWWAWSRHPNYFGEFSFWVSMALFGLAAAPEYWWWLGAGAVGMAAMFYGASIPMMEERSLARRPQYQHVIDTVPRFVPRPPRKTSV